MMPGGSAAAGVGGRVSAYESFVDGKLSRLSASGIAGQVDLPDSLFGHQAALTRWALKRGRGRWRERDATMAHLIDRGTTQTIARETANAAANLGAWIHERADEVARELELCALWDAAA